MWNSYAFVHYASMDEGKHRLNSRGISWNIRCASSSSCSRAVQWCYVPQSQAHRSTVHVTFSTSAERSEHLHLAAAQAADDHGKPHVASLPSHSDDDDRRSSTGHQAVSVQLLRLELRAHANEQQSPPAELLLVANSRYQSLLSKLVSFAVASRRLSGHQPVLLAVRERVHGSHDAVIVVYQSHEIEQDD